MSDALEYNNDIAQSIADAERGVWDDETMTTDEAVRGFMDACLDLQVTTVHSMHGSRFMDKITLLRTVGDPDTRVTVDVRRPREVRVSTWWGGRSAFCTIDAPTLGSVMVEAAGYLMEADTIDGGF
ncbi:MAG TPA: hypothetical protein VIG24_09370 [Acidimicrobiia bacterium]